MLDLLKNRSLYEAGFAMLITLFFALGVGFMGSIALKFQVALAIGMFGMLVIMLVPQRRTLCLFMWVLIQPLSVEKILYTGTPLWTDMRGQEIVLNAGDLILMLLGGILLFERFVLNKSITFWDSKSKWFLALFLWSIVSYLTHTLYLHSEFTQSNPIGILYLFRMLFFIVVMQAAIQTRSDVLWILVAVMIILVFESILVYLAAVTGKPYTFLQLIGAGQELRSYTAGGDTLIRATATLGVSNQQALFHSMFTFLLVGLFAVKRKVFHVLAIVAILMSFLAIIFTFARTAWLSIAIAAIFIIGWFAYKGKFTQRTWLIGSVLVIVGAVMLGAVSKPIYDRLTSGDNGATGSRVRMINLAVDLFAHHPVIGVGQAGYAEAGISLYPPGEVAPEWVALGEEPMVPPLGRVELATGFLGGKKIIVPLSVHNKFLLVLCELGAVGLLIWMMFFYRFYKEIKSVGQSKDNLYQYLGIAGMGILLISGVYMMLDLISDEKTTEILLFPLLLITAIHKINQRTQVTA